DLESLGSGMATKMEQSVRQHGVAVRRLAAHAFSRAGRRWYEIQLEKTAGKESVREITRLTLRDREAFSITATVPDAGWEAAVRTVDSLCDSLTLTPEPRR
ncbi:MAG TPA: hypothetical protein VMM92_01155, partial [Thermoanaerobaculia bacterium]|nr:hypothetical protein [Thermoanaerobaculia bacterium]